MNYDGDRNYEVNMMNGNSKNNSDNNYSHY